MKQQFFTRVVVMSIALLLGNYATAQTESCGPITLELYDSYGDGWNGNDIDVVSTSGTTSYTLSSGYSSTYSLAVGFGDTLDFVWQAGGSYTTECSYVIKDGSGDTLYSSPLGSVMTAGATQIRIYCNTLASCPMPTNLTVTTTPLDAGLSWSTSGSYLYHLVEYDTAGFTPGTGDTLWVYDDTTFISGLNPATAYDFRVTTICNSSDSSTTASTFSVYTQCAALATPWTDNLDAASSGGSTNPSLPICWEYYTGVSNASIYATYHYIYSYISNSSSNSLRTYRSSSSSYVGDTAMSLTPEIQGLDSATKMLEFYGRKGYSSYPGEVIIGVTNAAGDASSLTIVDTVYMNSDAFEKYTVYLDAAAGVSSGDARVAFVTVCNGVYDYMYMDDITVKDIPPCPEPIGLSLVATTQASATISWSSSSAAFNIEVGPMGFTQGTGEGTSATSTTTSYTATGLTQNTYYDIYIQSNCTAAGKGTSSWEGPFTFKTECGDQVVPYSNGFEGYSSGNTISPNLPDCWAYGKTGTSTSLYAYNYNYSFYSNTGTNSVRFYGYSSTTSTNSADGDTLAVFSPRFSALNQGNLQVSFAVRTSSSVAYYNNKLIIAVADSNASLSSIHIVDTVTYTSSYSQVVVDLENLPSYASRIVFMVVPEFVSGYSYSYTYAYVDDIQVIEILPCETPGTPMVNYTTGTQASLSWLGSGGSSFNVKYGPQGFDQATGAIQVVTNDSSLVLTGLQPNTSYDVYVQNNCSAVGDGLSYWTVAQTFTTKCDVQSLPITQNFDYTPSGSSINPSSPECWDYFKTGNYAYSVYGYTNGSNYYAKSGSNSFYIYSTSSTLYNDSMYLISPDIGDISNKSVELKFSARPSSSSSSYNTELYIRALDSMNNEVANIAMIPLEQTIGAVEYADFNFMLDSIPGGSKVAFMIKNNGSSQGLNIDDIEINEITECYYVQGFNVDSIGTDNIQVSWDQRFSDSIQVTVVPEGLGKINGTTYTSASGSLTVNGLISGASYDVYYDEYCSTGLSGFEQMTTITTKATFAPCEITFELYDSYGDGWNNGQFGYRLLTDNNGTILDSGILTMSSGGQATISVNTALLNQTDSVEVYHISSGAYPSEMSMAIYDGTGMLIDSITSGNYFASFKFAPGCAGGGCIASALNITGGQTFAIFEHSADTIRYSVQAIGSTLNTASIIETTDSTFTINGFTYYTGYQVYYQMPCTGGSWTPWAVKFFETSCDQLNYSFGNSPSSNTCSQLIFSEYIEGSSNNKGFEIYNPADSAISLSGYTIYLSGNGGSYTNSFTSSATIASGDVYAIVTNQADTVLQAQADTALSYPSVAHYNGDDALILVQGTDTIDVIGVPGVDPGSSWTVGTGSTANNTLVRKAAVNYGSTDWTSGSSEWEVYPQNTYNYLGAHSYTCAASVDTSSGTEYCYGTSVQYSLSGNAIVESFKWFRDGQLVATTTTPILSIPSATPADAGAYSVTIENRCGMQVIDLGSFTVLDTLGINAVSAVNTCLDLDAMIDFDITGPYNSRTLAYGASTTYGWPTDSIAISNVSYSDSGDYQMTISNSCETKSATVKLNVIEGTTITAVSPETYVCSDSTEAIYVTGLGNSLQYQWSANGVAVANSNNDTILIPSPADTVLYAVEVSGICSADTSLVSLANASVLIRTRQSSEITSTQADLTLCEGDAINLGYSVVGHDLQYSWLKDGAALNTVSQVSASIANSKGLGSGGGNYNFYGSPGLLFKASKPFILDSVTIYPNGAGTTNIQIQDSATNTVVWSGSVTTQATNNTAEQVYLGASLQPGSYRILPTSSTTGGLYREYGVSGYPYSTPDGAVTIIQGTLNNYHYFFYDWRVTIFSGTSTYSYTNAMHAESGNYQFAISGTCGVDTSAEVVVDVRKTTDYLAGMSNIEVCVGDEFTMPLSYDGHDVSVVIHKVGSTSPIAPTTSTISGCGELFFSEYIEGSSNNKGFEIFNPSSNAVSLSGYTVYLSGNGGTYTNTFTSNATIAPGGVYVICTNQASSTMQAVADTILSYPSVSHYNGDDALILVNGTDTIDVIGVPGVDPGSSWTVGTGSTANHTLVRKANIGEGSTDWATGSMEWDVYAQNTYSYLGSHTFTCSSNTVSTAFGLSNISYNDEGYYYAEFDGSCGTVYSDTIFVTVHTTTAITSTFSNPLNVICEDAGIDFSFAVEGHGLTYAWNQNGSAAGSDSTLQITTADTAQSGFYQLITSGTCGVDTSQVLQLIVHPTTQVLSTFADTSICQDADMTLPVATDGFNVTYKWYQNGTQISTSNSLVITDGLSSDNGEYQLALNGYCGTDSSNTFDVLVMPTTEVFTSLGDTTACIDDAHVLAVVDTGYMNTYQWYKNGIMLTGETDSTLSFSTLTSSDTASYQLVASGSCGTDSSALISLGAWKTTTLTSTSPSFDICKGNQALMYMDVDGDFVTYSWAKDGFNLPGSTNDTLILNNVQPAFAGYFIGTATGICGTAVTDSIQMSVHQIPNVVQEPISDTLCQYDNTSLTVNATGFGVTYDWYFNGAMVGSGATLDLDSIMYAQQGNYVAVADGFCGLDSSQAAYVKVDAILPSINAPSLSFEICELDTIPLNATSLLGQGISAEWYRDSTLVGTNTSYNLTDSGMYYVVLTDLVTGCVESTPGVEVIERPVPQPITIYGEDTLAQNLPTWYWVALEPNVDYDWSIPTGAIVAGWFSDSVEIKFSGSGAHMVYLEAKNQFDCTTNLELQVWVSGIGFMENELVKFTLYPNPTISWTVLELDQVLSSNASIRVVDAKGATVMEQTMLKGEQTFRMDLTTLRNGQYMVVIPELGITVPVVKAD